MTTSRPEGDQSQDHTIFYQAPLANLVKKEDSSELKQSHEQATQSIHTTMIDRRKDPELLTGEPTKMEGAKPAVESSTSSNRTVTSRASVREASTRDESSEILRRSSSLISREFTMESGINPDVQIIANGSFQKHAQKMEALTIGKLKFNSCLYGRDLQMTKLKESLQRVKESQQHTTELVLIDGSSGSGKTSLATSIENGVRRSHGAFLQGKFDLTTREEPYTALANAFQHLCLEALDILSPEAFILFQQETMSNLDSLELRLLHGIIPLMSKIAPLTKDERIDLDNIKSEDKKSRLEFAFLKFIQVASAAFCPLVIFLDDLQWGDVSSLHLLEALSSDRYKKSALIICSYRTNEVNSALSRTLLGFQRQAAQGHLSLTELSVGNLGVSDVNEIIMDLLSTDESATMPLAELCHKRTMGNPFFLKMFLTVLNDDGLLTFNFGSFQWQWDIGQIEKLSVAQDNVVHLIQTAIKRNSNDEMVNMLLCVSCLGNICEKRHIRLVWGKSFGQGMNKAVLDNLLARAVEELFLEPIGSSGQYRFSHDAVKEAVIALIPKADFETHQSRVGRILFLELNDEELESMLFLVADLLHRSQDQDRNLSKLLLRAAKKAKSVSAFSSASFYASNGIKRLPRMWQVDVELAVELHVIAAEAERCLGNLHEATKKCKTIIDREDINIFQKIGAHQVMIDILTQDDEFFVSLDYSLDVLKSIGCNFPRTSVGQGLAAVGAIKKAKSDMFIPNAEYVEKLAVMTDPRKKYGMEVMVSATHSAFFNGSPLLTLLILTRRIWWTVKYGFHASSAPACATMAGVYLHVLGDWERGRRMADLSFQFMDKAKKLGMTSCDPPTGCRLSMFILPWINPARPCLTLQMDTYKQAMRQGDLDSAFKTIVSFIFLQLFSGKDLNAVATDCERYTPPMKVMKYGKWDMMLNISWQAALNLLGASDHTTLLKGKGLNEEEFLSSEIDVFQRVQNVMLMKRFLCALFGEYEEGAENALKYGKEWAKAYPGVFFGFDTFHSALCLYGAARNIQNRHSRGCSFDPSKLSNAEMKKLRIFKKEAQKLHGQISSWVSKGAPNHVHHLRILNAERAALTGFTVTTTRKSESVCKLYRQAIVDSVRVGFMNHAALAEERFAEYLFSVQDEEEASFHLQNAVWRYSEWGASRKVEILRQKCAAWNNGRNLITASIEDSSFVEL